MNLLFEFHPWLLISFCDLLWLFVFAYDCLCFVHRELSKPDKLGGDANHAELNPGETKKDTRDSLQSADKQS